MEDTKSVHRSFNEKRRQNTGEVYEIYCSFITENRYFYQECYVLCLLHAYCNASGPVVELLAEQWDWLCDESMAFL